MIDWSRLLPHWDRRPYCLPGVAHRLTPERAFALIVQAAAPFRAGTRFMALPDVRFYLDGGLMRAPGDLLPGEEDRDAPAYVRRVRERLHGARFQLRVSQPLFLDERLWSATRDLLAGLFAAIGCPALPVDAAFWVGDAQPQTLGARLDPRHACLRLPLLGASEVRLWRSRPRRERAPEQILRARPGELLCWPGRRWYEEADDGATLGLALAIPTHAADAMIAAKNLLAEQVDDALGEDERVAMLAFPPRAGRHGIAALAPLTRVGAAATAAVAGGGLERALRLTWAARASAWALEPVPAPREESALHEDDCVQLDPRSPLLRLRDGEGWVWAINGHVFAMPEHPRAQQLLDELRDGQRQRVADLCRSQRRGRIDRGVLDLLQRLYALRAVLRSGEEAA